MRYKTWQEFFRTNDEAGHVGLDTYGGETAVSVEDLYQHFKARMVAELLVESPELLERAKLIDAA